jgi:Raf kinase inhibitor-like YbhB/YbcL family protein
MHVRRPAVFAFFATLIAVALTACSDSSKTTLPGSRAVQADVSQNVVVLRPPGTPSNIPVLTVTSSDFTNGGPLPRSSALTGCSGGSNVSPQIAWTAGPEGTKSYLLTTFDPQAPTGVGFWHWIVVNIPPSVRSFATGAGTHVNPPAIETYTDYGSPGYGGPCPPAGDIVHHYVFTVSALNVPTIANVTAASTGAFVTFSSRGAIIAQGTLVGTFSL